MNKNKRFKYAQYFQPHFEPDISHAIYFTEDNFYDQMINIMSYLKSSQCHCQSLHYKKTLKPS